MSHENGVAGAVFNERWDLTLVAQEARAQPLQWCTGVVCMRVDKVADLWSISAVCSGASD